MKHTQIEKRPFLTKTIHRNQRTKKLCAPDDDEAEVLVVPTKRVRLIGGRLYSISAHTHVVDGHVLDVLGGEPARRRLPRGEPRSTPLFEN